MIYWQFSCFSILLLFLSPCILRTWTTGEFQIGYQENVLHQKVVGWNTALEQALQDSGHGTELLRLSENIWRGISLWCWDPVGMTAQTPSRLIHTLVRWKGSAFPANEGREQFQMHQALPHQGTASPGWSLILLWVPHCRLPGRRQCSLSCKQREWLVSDKPQVKGLLVVRDCPETLCWQSEWHWGTKARPLCSAVMGSHGLEWI